MQAKGVVQQISISQELKPFEQVRARQAMSMQGADGESITGIIEVPVSSPSWILVHVL
jgi:hypothetical protein